MKYHRGFTLIELLVVISIIALLSSIVLASLSNARSSARDIAITVSARQLKTALITYFFDHNSFPTLQTDSNDVKCLGDTSCVYINSIPKGVLPAEDGLNSFGKQDANMSVWLGLKFKGLMYQCYSTYPCTVINIYWTQSQKTCSFGTLAMYPVNPGDYGYMCTIKLATSTSTF